MLHTELVELFNSFQMPSFQEFEKNGYLIVNLEHSKITLHGHIITAFDDNKTRLPFRWAQRKNLTAEKILLATEDCSCSLFAKNEFGGYDLHTDNHFPALVKKDGEISWYRNGICFNEENKISSYNLYTEEFHFTNSKGKWHRNDGKDPAYFSPTHGYYHFANHKLHNLHGPARYNADMTNPRYFINGEEISLKDFLNK